MRSEQSSAPVAEGDVLAGKYKVERVLGAGGMGVVVAARHLQLDQLVALKFVLPDALKDAMVVERFLREAKAAVRLKSEHVAKVLDVGTLDSGAPYIVMEYLEGTDLAGVIAEQAPMSPEVACDYLIQVCEALSEAHSIGIVHRDLKPQNLFLTKGVGGAPLVKVLDFGISKIRQAEGAQNLTQTASVIGSPLYMAPEQMRSARNVDERTDIWSLGVVLYEMLTGALPFEAEALTDLAIKIVQEPFTPIESHRPTLLPELAAIVARCLEKVPANRFADAGELASALEPLAPAASRVVADRARKVISANQKTMGMAVSPLMSQRADASGPSRAVSSPTHKSASAPEAWSETKDKKANGGKASTLVVALAAAGVTLVLALLGFRAFSHAPAPPIEPVTQPRVEMAPVPTPTAVATPTPTPTATPTPTPTATASPSLSASPRPSPHPHPSASPPKPPPSAKPNQSNDDIPSLR